MTIAMMKINTGQGSVSLISLLAIWSVSLVVNLPGLAISPMLGQLSHIFPGTSQIEIQLLTIVPNLIIIPFVLLSGKLAESRSKISILTTALFIYLGSGILCFFASSIVELIVIGALMGLGCGLVIPIAASLLSDTFVGPYRIKQLGIKSGIANLSLVVATLLVGLLEQGSWRMPFVVYLIPAIPLALAVYLPRESKNLHIADRVEVTKVVGLMPRYGLNLRKIVPLMGLYFFICYATVTVAYNLPFLAGRYAVSDFWLGTVTSLFFLMIFLPGVLLPLIIRKFGQWVSIISLLSIAVGLLLVAVGDGVVWFAVGVSLMGAGVGVLQPIIYDKSVECAANERKTTLALSFVLATNYVAVASSPVLIDIFSHMLGFTASDVFPFAFNAFLGFVMVGVSFFLRRSFIFRMEESYSKN